MEEFLDWLYISFAALFVPQIKEGNKHCNCILNTVLSQNYFLKNSVVKNATEL